jgi:hypothetical protein
VPSAPGGYVVFRPRTNAPTFLAVNPGDRFKGRDPSVSTERLHAEWVSGTPVVYIGKADILRTRLTSFARFGAGKPVGHWGGRLIWQLADSAELLVAWRPLAEDGTAREFERRLLRRFAELYDGQLPFANGRIVAVKPRAAFGRYFQTVSKTPKRQSGFSGVQSGSDGDQTHVRHRIEIRRRQQ